MKTDPSAVTQTSAQGGKTRLAIQTWIGVYPVLTMIAVTLEPFVSNLPIPIRTMAMTVLMVPIMVFWIMPVISRIGEKR